MIKLRSFRFLYYMYVRVCKSIKMSVENFIMLVLEVPIILVYNENKTNWLLNKNPINCYNTKPAKRTFFTVQSRLLIMK